MPPSNREYTTAKLEEMMEKSAEEKRKEHVEAAKTKERLMVMNTKVLIHGTWRRDEKENESVTLLLTSTASHIGQEKATKRPG